MWTVNLYVCITHPYQKDSYGSTTHNMLIASLFGAFWILLRAKTFSSRLLVASLFLSMSVSQVVQGIWQELTVYTRQLNLGYCVLRADYPLGAKEMHVSLYQASILMLFNTVDELSYTYAVIVSTAYLIIPCHVFLAFVSRSFICDMLRWYAETPFAPVPLRNLRAWKKNPWSWRYYRWPGKYNLFCLMLQSQLNNKNIFSLPSGLARVLTKNPKGKGIIIMDLKFFLPHDFTELIISRRCWRLWYVWYQQPVQERS